MSGRLIYVVGPSGAGKDSVIAWARAQVPPGAPLVFARRTITRPADAGGEDHEAVSRQAFAARVRSHRYTLHWEANGLRYGISRELDAWLAQGLDVIVSGSRGHLPFVCARYPQLHVVHITADRDVLRARLLQRGREQASDIDARLARTPALLLPKGIPLTEIRNGAALGEAGSRFLKLLTTGAAVPAERA
jgi:ribose 1,5-bisphosphokinase